jgi:hypothetical protein
MRGNEPAGLDDLIAPQMQEEKYGTPTEMAKTAGEGLLSGVVSSPVATGIEQAFGATDEGILGRRNTNPGIHAVTEAAGLIAPAIATGGESLAGRLLGAGLYESAAKVIAEKAGIRAGESLASKVGAGMAKQAIEGSLLGSGDEVAKMMIHDPDQTAQSAMVNIGLMGALSAPFGIIHPLAGAAADSKLGQEASNLVGRIKWHAENQNPVETMTNEISQYYKGLRSVPEDTVPAEMQKGMKWFEKTFTREVVDPVSGAVSKEVTPEAIAIAVKKDATMENLQSFIKASDKFKSGLETPIPPTPMNITSAMLGVKTPGAKLADILVDHGIADLSGHGLGALMGEKLGSLAGESVGIPGAISAMLGSKVLGPWFSSILKPITHAALGVATHDGPAFRTAFEYAAAAARGDSMLSKAAKNVFREGVEVISDSQRPTDKDRAKLDKLVNQTTLNPEKLIDANTKLNHYMPEQSMALNANIGNAIATVKMAKQSQVKKAPLDTQPVMSADQKAKYQNTLNIAQSPITALEKVKNGTITQHDVQTLQQMYPAAYNSMKSKLLMEMTDHIAKGQQVPYKTRIGLSLFLAMPLDSSMAASSILAAQPVARQAPMPPQQGGKGRPSSPALQKMGSMYQTPGQSGEQRRNKQ